MSDRKSYIPPVELGAVMRAGTLSQVVQSRNPKFQPGDVVVAMSGWQEYEVSNGRGLMKTSPIAGHPLTVYMGVLGMTGLTAYFGLLDVGMPVAGDTVLISGAAGATGSIVGQIAKIKGCRVVGMAGSADKCKWLVEELGFDAAINYKTEDVDQAIRKACPKGINVYFDNVGGPILDKALKYIRQGARVVICGAISGYNNTVAAPGPSNYVSLLVNRARMEGFIVFDYAKRFTEAVMEMAGWLIEGKLRYHEDIIQGIENCPTAIIRLFSGANTGKQLIQVAPLPAAIPSRL